MFAKLTTAFLAVCLATFARAGDIKLENEFATWLIGPTGHNLSLVDKQSGNERCALPGKRSICTLRKDGASHTPSACTYAGGKMTLKFEKAATTVVLKVACKKHYFVFEVESISSPGIDSMVLGNLAVTSGKYVSGMSCVAADDEFAVAIRPANLQMRASVGGRPVGLSVVCSSKHGLIGAKMAVAACPADRVRTVLGEIVRSEGLPYSLLGGPFALDAQENRGSYVFASVSEANVDDYNARGALVKNVKPEGEAPTLAAGASQVKFTCNGPDGLRSRAKVTLIGSGPPLRGCASKDQVRWELLEDIQ